MTGASKGDKNGPMGLEGRFKGDRAGGDGTNGHTNGQTNGLIVGDEEEEGNYGAMDSEEFRKRGYETVDYIINYLDNIK